MVRFLARDALTIFFATGAVLILAMAPPMSSRSSMPTAKCRSTWGTRLQGCRGDGVQGHMHTGVQGYRIT